MLSNQGTRTQRGTVGRWLPLKASNRTARRNAWIWSLATVSLLAVALPAGAAADVPLGSPVNVPVDGSKAYSPPLRAGATYRVVATGTYTKTNVSTGQRLSYDAAYCFDEQPARIGGCTRLRAIPTLRFIVRFEGDPSYPFLDSLDPTNQLPYDDVSHRYEQKFTAPRSGRLEAYEFDGGGGVYAQQGKITLQFYGSARKKRKRTKRIGGCPAARRSVDARAAATCHWVVNFDINQSGEPRNSIPAAGAGFVDSETIAIGKVFFNAEPRRGRSSVGSAAGVFRHIDTYQSTINPFSFTEGEVAVEALTAIYTLGRGEVRLRLDGVVSSVAGPVYSQDPGGRSTQPGDPGRLHAVYDFPRHRDDTLTTYLGCLLCRGSARGDHGHHFVTRPDSVLRVTISRPKQLAGRCRCKA